MSFTSVQRKLVAFCTGFLDEDDFDGDGVGGSINDINGGLNGANDDFDDLTEAWGAGLGSTCASKSMEGSSCWCSMRRVTMLSTSLPSQLDDVDGLDEE